MHALSTPAFLRLVRVSAWYDLIVTAPFATPWSFALLHDQLSATNRALGGVDLPPFLAFHVLIACLLGSIVLVWSVLRLRSPEVRFGRYDGVARVLFSSWMAWALGQTGAPILWLFIVPEAGFGILQLLPLRQTGKSGQFA